ncbi:MAG TPA: SpoIIE family protein phosphatase [Polyangiaceae bacterium]
MSRDVCGVVAWADACRARPGSVECGDRSVVASFPDGVTLALIDGLGHGHEAALASDVIAAAVSRHASEGPVEVLQRCHEEARSTRGAVVAVARLDARSASISWAGVGNIDALLLRASLSAASSRDALISRGGVVGKNLPPLHASTTPIARGDVLVFTTDGIKGTHHAILSPHVAVEILTKEVLTGFAKESDDAAILVARYEGGFATDTTIAIREESDVAIVRKGVRERAGATGLDTTRVEALATAASEIARNVVVHAGTGSVSLGECVAGQRKGVLVIARDDGPGIRDVERALLDGYTTAGTLGLGLPSAKRLVDEFQIVSAPGRGTTVVLRKWAS